ncbi:hypothetical protein O181_004776 [Austropuccinia psidii MF-1]|uniref:Uncharacterized protein n=1 Tax=Austropuccinia psidii MF-1 TaxID=1389203 RepID=A0A9Q3BG64_9BASI|nr:hypothetical protein [Austropuccinia psidii MF-1]
MPSETEGNKGQGKGHSESLITTRKWTPIATQRSRKPEKSASIQGTLESKGTSQKTEKAGSEPEYKEQDTLDTVLDGNTLRENTPTLPFTFQCHRNLKPEDCKDIDQVLQLHKLLKDLLQWSMDKKRFNLESHWEELEESCQRISLKEIPFKDLMAPEHQWPRVTIMHNPRWFLGEDKDTKGKQDLFHPQAERVRPNSPEAVGVGEISTQEPEIVVNTSRISSPTNRNITPTHNKHDVVKPENNSRSDQLWLQMSRFAVQTHEKFDELKRSNESLKELTNLHGATVKAIEESCAKL